MGAKTKSERLEELAFEKAFYKSLDKEFDKGWREFAKELSRRNDISNLRMLKILLSIKGEDFVNDLVAFMETTRNKSAYIEFTKRPKGMLLQDSRFPTIPELMVDKFRDGSYRQGRVYIQVTINRWIGFTF